MIRGIFDLKSLRLRSRQQPEIRADEDEWFGVIEIDEIPRACERRCELDRVQASKRISFEECRGITRVISET